MHLSRIVILAGALVAALSLPFPLVELPVEGAVDGIEGDSWPVVAVLTILALAAVLGDRGEAFTSRGTILAVAAAGAAVIGAVVKLADAVRAVDGVTDGALGSGIWMLVAGSLVALAGAAAGVSRRL